VDPTDDARRRQDRRRTPALGAAPECPKKTTSSAEAPGEHRHGGDRLTVGIVVVFASAALLTVRNVRQMRRFLAEHPGETLQR
jgi:hypothetical protein